jgi:antitoxin component of MazEF toxin-antitoxin module
MIMKTVQIGESVAVIIPRKMCQKMGISLGDHVSIEIKGKVNE